MTDLAAFRGSLQPTSERSALEAQLTYCRRAAAVRIEDLDDDAAASQPLPRTHLSVGGVIKHLAYVEDRWFVGKFKGEPLPEPWLSSPIGINREASTEPDWPFTSSRSDSVTDLVALYGAACERSRAVVAACASLDDVAVEPSFGKAPVNLRWLLVHMVNETAWHLGHLDLLRDALGAPPAPT